MDSLSYKTQFLNSETVQKDWILIDAENEVLGRLASQVAKILRGKHKPGYTPHVDCGDNVIITNADKVVMTGNKMTEKEYVSYTGYAGGKVVRTPEQYMENGMSEKVIMNAVKGMLPKSKLGNALLKNLRVYPGTEHEQEAQNPKEIKLNEIK